MNDSMLSISRLHAARIAGAMYLIGMAAAIFGESFVRGSLIVSGDAAQTAQNILDAESLFRLSIATDLFTYITVLVLTWALYVLLKPVSIELALLAVFFRIAEVAAHFVSTLNSMNVLRFLGDASYLQAFNTDQLQALALMAVYEQGKGLGTGFILLGIGSSIFAFLLLKSSLVPKWLAVLGIFASLLLAGHTLLRIIAPDVGQYWIYVMPPMGIYEVTLGFWLLFKRADSIPDAIKSR
jgi:hypothetical protein